MKKIKVLAILMAMALTLSMFATAASAVDVTLDENGLVATTGNLTAYTITDFKENVTNAKYAALFKFDNNETPESGKSNKTQITVDYKLSADIKDAPNGEKCEMTFKEATNVSIYNFADDYSYGSGAGAISDYFASGKDLLYLAHSTSFSVDFNELENLKPVAIGYAVGNYKVGTTSTQLTSNVEITYNDGSTSGNIETSQTGRSLRFFGHKAPVGKYITSVKITNKGTSASQHLRIDDLCVVYQELSEIEKGVRFSKDANGYVEYTDINQVEEGDSFNAIVSSKYSGEKIVLAMYDSAGKLCRVVKSTTSATSLAMGIDANTHSKAKTAKVFIWDKDTLVPVGVNATLD